MNFHLQAFWQEAADKAATAGWREQALPPEFARLEGRAGEEPVTMESRAWAGGPFRTVRTTWLHSPERIEVFNLVAYPETRCAAPIFATDIVLLRGQLRIAVVDAMPVRAVAEDSGYAARWVEPFMSLRGMSEAQFPRFDLRQEWSQHYLGPAACLATGIGAERLPELRALWRGYWEKYLTLAAAEPPAAPEAAAAVAAFHREYNREHAEVELKRNPLMRYYGAEAGGRFVKEFLFRNEE